jgi:peroxiredoxin/uncharacterized membrane protein YphA (DoxX/SURF4 family)
MTGALLLSRITLALILGVAGVAKLLDLAGSRRAMLAFGLPARLAPAFALLVPLGELASALALLIYPLARLGALGALGLLLAFMAGILFNLAQGRKPDCHCFGQLHSAPVGWTTLTRNTLMALLAALVLWQGPGASFGEWSASLVISSGSLLVAGVFLLLVVGVQAWFLVQLFLQNGRLMLRLEVLEARLTNGGIPGTVAETPTKGLPVGASAPAFNLPGLYGESLTLDALRAAGHPVLLVFIDPGCAPCKELLPELSGWQKTQANQLSVVLISRGSVDANRNMAVANGLIAILLQNERQVSEPYQVKVTPSALLVQADGSIGSPLAEGVVEITTLVQNVLRLPLASREAGAARRGNGASAAPAALKPGDRVPAVKLEDLGGQPVEIDSLENPTLLIFWNPDCGYCQRMLPDLRAWEASQLTSAPQLIIVSRGTVAANLAQGLHAQIVLDQEFKTARLFGADGTPSAITLDAHGTLSSPLAVGTEAVLALANRTVIKG